MSSGLNDSISLERRERMVIMLKIGLGVCAAWIQQLIGLASTVKQGRQVKQDKGLSCS